MKAHDEHCMSIAISACGKAKQADAAVSLLSPSAGVGSYNAAIIACGRSGHWEEAIAVLDRMVNSSSVAPTTLTYTTAITACSKAKAWEAALQLLDDIEAQGLKPTASAYNAAMLVCDRAGEWQAVLQLLEDMQSRGLYNEAALNTAVRACSRCGQFDHARLVLARATSAQSVAGGAIKTAEAPQHDFDHHILRESDFKGSTTSDSSNIKPTRAHLAHFSGLRRVDGTGASAHKRAKRWARHVWAVGVYTAPEIELDVVVAPDRAAGRNCLKIIFIDRGTARKVGFMLIENERARDERGGGTSALRGLRIDDEHRGRGLTKVLIAIWLHVCLVAGMSPRAAEINKPILSHTLERRFGFVPDGGVAVRVSSATRRRDCIVDRRDDGEAVHVQTGFTAPTATQLEHAVAEVIGSADARILIEPEHEALARAMLGKRGL